MQTSETRTERENACVIGDCLSEMKSLGAKSIDHLISDPPYEDSAHHDQVAARRAQRNRHLESVEKQELSFEPLTDETRVLYALEMVRVTRGWVLVFCQAEAVGKWKAALEYAGATYKRTCAWVKPNAMPQFSGDRPGQGYEQFVCAWCSPGRSVWNGGGKIGLYFHAIPRGNDRYHETQKPFGLMAEMIEDFTNPGQIILDPFAGSGTTLIAAKALGRRFLGIEQNPEYAKIANERILDPASLPERFRGSQLALL